ncbi:MAG: PQQ-dependent sugar dehydrogenase [Thermoproteota archaeon]|nr:PQQ-dependent sugar dehydrogenase [Thermoproteota archaeon]
MYNIKLLLYFFTIILILFSSSYSSVYFSYGAYSKAQPSPDGPTINDDSLTVEKVTSDLTFPTSMTFVGNNDILVTEKNTGRVMRVLDGQVQDYPLLDLSVAAKIERGLLGIAASTHLDGKTFVFLYYTESGNNEDGSDVSNNVDPLGNRLYRYQYVDGKLIDPVLLLDLTAIPNNLNRTDHNGGKVTIGPDNNVYMIIGEVGGHRTQAQNIGNGPAPNGLGGVLRITQDGGLVDDAPIFGADLPLGVYYAMGIRNSFGIDFDPMTGNLWDTENGPTAGDEINLVFPGFNSGWSLIQGFSNDDLLGNGATPSDLVSFGNGKYAEPKFAWHIPIGPTALKFLNSDKLGKEYENNMFVGDINNGNLYRFTLNEARDDIDINNTYVGGAAALADKKVDNTVESIPITFGQGFGGITDIQVGPDGYIYVLSFTGDLYKILPTSQSTVPKAQSPLTQSSVVPKDSVLVTINGISGDNSYAPNPITINSGETITWYNADTVSHTTTSGSDGDPNEGQLFDSDAILSKQAFTLKFDNKGTFDYYCVYHPSMVGEIVVK